MHSWAQYHPLEIILWWFFTEYWPKKAWKYSQQSGHKPCAFISKSTLRCGRHLEPTWGTPSVSEGQTQSLPLPPSGQARAGVQGLHPWCCHWPLSWLDQRVCGHQQVGEARFGTVVSLPWDYTGCMCILEWLCYMWPPCAPVHQHPPPALGVQHDAKQLDLQDQQGTYTRCRRRCCFVWCVVVLEMFVLLPLGCTLFRIKSWNDSLASGKNISLAYLLWQVPNQELWVVGVTMHTHLE